MVGWLVHYVPGGPNEKNEFKKEIFGMRSNPHPHTHKENEKKLGGERKERKERKKGVVAVVYWCGGELSRGHWRCGVLWPRIRS